MSTPDPIDIKRLKRRPEFLRVAAARRKWVTPGLILQVRRRDNPDSDYARVGFTVSKKVGNAVRRNRAKRRLRAVVDKVMEPYARTGYDYVVIGRQGTLTRPFSALTHDLLQALKKMDVHRAP